MSMVLLKRIEILVKTSLKKRYDAFPPRVKEGYKNFEDFVQKSIVESIEDLQRRAENNPCSGGWYKGHSISEKDKELVHPTCTQCGKLLERYHGKYEHSGDPWRYRVWNKKKTEAKSEK